MDGFANPRVVHVVGGLGIGGGQKLTALVASGLRGRGYDITVINLGSRGVYEDYLRRNGIPVVSLGMVEGHGPRSLSVNIAGVVKLWALLVKGHWDIVHTHMFRTALVTVPVCKIIGSRVFGTSHRIYYPRWQPRTERLLSRWQEAIVVDSAAVRDILRSTTGIRPERYVVIHNGIDADEFVGASTPEDARLALNLPPDAVVVTCVAHLAPHKGQQFLVEAFARVAEQHQYAHLLLIGDGPLRVPLARRVVELDLTNRVHLMGSRRDLARILVASDVLALPSVFEGFGIVQAEAMHLGLPVIATNRGGSTEVVEDGVTGHLVAFGDVEALAEQLENLLGDPHRRTAMGSAGKERADRLFTLASMVEGYERLYSPMHRAKSKLT